MFANIYLEIEAMVRKELISKANDIGLVEDWFSLYSIDIDLLGSEAEISGLDKIKGEEFTIFYDYAFKSGRIHYYDGVILRFKG